MDALALKFPNFASPFNVTGQPAISIPVAWTDDGIPVGTQLAGRRGDDALLIRVAHDIERAQHWSDRAPDNIQLEGLDAPEGDSGRTDLWLAAPS